MVRNMGLLLWAVFASWGEAYCGLERERVFLRGDKVGLRGCWVVGNCKMR